MLLNKIKSPVRAARRRLTMWREKAAMERQWRAFQEEVRAPRLESKIIVSITSYPPRYGTLPLTLKTLLMQSLREYRLILWIAHQDYAALPRSVRDLTRFGLEIMTCPDLRVFTKLVPAMRNFPQHTIVTADDDVCYWPTWLEELVTGYIPGNREVLCHRMHRIRLNEDGSPGPYQEWSFDCDTLEPHPLNFATGVGGVLYPPGVFSEDAFDESAIFSRCPTADDVWYYWMARRNGYLARKVPSARTSSLKLWSGSQEVALWHQNVVDHENDRLIRNMIAGYGFPASDVLTRS